MAVENHSSDDPPAVAASRGIFSAIIVAAACLTKIARHLALLASLAIIGAADGRGPIGQVAIFLVVVAAALFHSCGASLRRISKRQLSPRQYVS